MSCTTPIRENIEYEVEKNCSFTTVVPSGSLALEPFSDIASWPENISDKFRDQCIQYGPQYFQNRLGILLFIGCIIHTKAEKRRFCG